MYLLTVLFLSRTEKKLPPEEMVRTKGICRLVKNSMWRLRKLP
jgi:hypothetical protein